MVKKEDVIFLAKANERLFRNGFVSWLDLNYPIFEEFVRQARAIRETGRTRYSARIIIEYIRHETALREASGSFKVNNNAVPDIARLYLLLHPGHVGLFAMRRGFPASLKKALRQRMASEDGANPGKASWSEVGDALLEMGGAAFKSEEALDV